MALYAAYGSNMDPAQMATRAPHSPAARLRLDRRLAADLRRRGPRLGGALATVVEEPGSQVFVALYDVPRQDERNLDHWEGGDTVYRKVRVRVQTLDGDVLAWLYVLDGYEGGVPSARYIGILADAAEAAGAPDDYVTDLRSRPCRSVGP
jgi:hypothetical protein